MSNLIGKSASAGGLLGAALTPGAVYQAPVASNAYTDVFNEQRATQPTDISVPIAARLWIAPLDTTGQFVMGCAHRVAVGTPADLARTLRGLLDAKNMNLPAHWEAPVGAVGVTLARLGEQWVVQMAAPTSPAEWPPKPTLRVAATLESALDEAIAEMGRRAMKGA